MITVTTMHFKEDTLPRHSALNIHVQATSVAAHLVQTEGYIITT